jgi:hypothetical protein
MKQFDPGLLDVTEIRVCDHPLLLMTVCGRYAMLVGINIAEDYPDLAVALQNGESAIYVSLEYLEADVQRARAILAEKEKDESV